MINLTAYLFDFDILQYFYVYFVNIVEVSSEGGNVASLNTCVMK